MNSTDRTALRGKERAYLRGLANRTEPTVQAGKAGVTPELVDSLDEALTARELVKVSVLQNCETDVRDVADTLAGRARAQVVQVVGRKVTLYRRNAEKPRIELPKP